MSPSGYALEAGTVVEASTRFATIEFDRVFHLQSQSGSPLISQMTGKVVGILARGGASDGKVFIMTAPSAGILAAIEAAKNTPKLEAVVGK